MFGGLELLVLGALKTALVGGAILAAVITVITITVIVIESFFDDWKTDHDIDPDDVGFMINEAISGRSATVIAGVFNKRTGKIRDGARRIEGTEGIDSDLVKTKVVIFD